VNLTAYYTIVRNHRDYELALPCSVTQDTGDGFLGEVCVLWSDEADALFAQYGFSGDELDGAVEAAENVLWLAEQAEERKAMVAQQMGNQGFFDARNDGRAA
jgi:hypothetical protein